MVEGGDFERTGEVCTLREVLASETADSSIGTAASHGCVRMRIPDVVELYDQVPVGAPIYIA